jgi:hypothetical protein
MIQHRAGGEHHLCWLYAGFAVLTAEPAEVTSLDRRYRIAMDFVIDDGAGNLTGPNAKACEEFAGIDANAAAAALNGSELEFFVVTFVLHHC